ncbi:MAG: hypothetical protein K8S13_01550 [Desulfobacula sp.]|uniref:hypothetical protein n=1 Tax=Desulfobacula sp. TaxID=2593537 RepID=UPI0025B84686|nr:hypothetical protein [Desulfobacula sp.]MCD4718533.1 hypothetical protein [Desulfobacula sp.]
MTEIKLRQDDDDLLPLIRKCTNDELDNIVGYITQKGGVSCRLKHIKSYKTHYPDHLQYVDEIAAEIQKFGGNTILNIMRKGKGVGINSVILLLASLGYLPPVISAVLHNMSTIGILGYAAVKNNREPD